MGESKLLRVMVKALSKGRTETQIVTIYEDGSYSDEAELMEARTPEKLRALLEKALAVCDEPVLYEYGDKTIQEADDDSGK